MPSYEEYRDKSLGDFIESRMLNGKRARRGSYKAECGTIKDKRDFCDRALKKLVTWDDLSVEAQKLAKRIYSFISKNN